MNSLYSSIRRSGLFSIDLDLGLGGAPEFFVMYSTNLSEMDNPNALLKYHQLLLAVLRIIASIVISCGQQNAQAMDRTRAFLVEYRPLMVATFKKHANVGALKEDRVEEYRPLDEVVEYFVLLTDWTDFLQVKLPIPSFHNGLSGQANDLKHEETQDRQQTRRQVFV